MPAVRIAAYFNDILIAVLGVLTFTVHWAWAIPTALSAHAALGFYLGRETIELTPWRRDEQP